uniref:Uncharacterized protein n=1 Tax=Parascaris equorum TaxID=6256 RepID=A0A914RCI1_PAREQ
MNKGACVESETGFDVIAPSHRFPSPLILSHAFPLTVSDIVPKELLDSYVKPVAFTLGRRNWPQLQETYAQLASDMQVMMTIFKQFPPVTKCFSAVTFYMEIWRVRQSLASSMHEVAAIIGEENADAHLVPVFEQFMKDVEDVRLGLLKHLYDFFKLVTPGTRKKLLTVLASFLHSDAENERNWRSRHEYTRLVI